MPPSTRSRRGASKRKEATDAGEDAPAGNAATAAASKPQPTGRKKPTRNLDVMREVFPEEADAARQQRRRREPMGDPSGIEWAPRGTSDRKKRSAAVLEDDDDDEDEAVPTTSDAGRPKKKAKKGPASKAAGSANADERDDVQRFWLMKAEPETRLEDGHDISFSIDDLAAKTEPEGWDGIRNYVAAKNMRMMKAGELAFFYHSNCKIPGIAGIMQIVREHSPDEAQFDSHGPYFDPKASRDKPRWVWVHVRFVLKFEKLVSLKELQVEAKPGKPLEGLQALKQTRLSVSNVQPNEWDCALGLAKVTQQEIDEALEELGPY